ncbi:MAG: serine racemase VanT catalytic subunit [Syntrophomonadaceae bacterium]|nr:serine racemase VanT catalytic subunit [Syntrophomonadaceae bacterium]
MTNLSKKEYAGINYFRLIAAFLVVAIHTSPLTELSGTADFALTRIFGRVAVPFFFMASGFFLFSKTEAGKLPPGKLAVFLKKTTVLYAIAILLYLPLNIYAGKTEEWRYFPNLLKDIVFDGTVYHLWYLPAAIFGACIVWLLLKKLKPGPAFIISLLLYVIGLCGDSYYGIAEQIPFLKAFYQNLFLFSDYTRNGLFFAPVFFMLGALLAGPIKRIPLKTCLIGLMLSFALMLAEGLLLHGFNLQRHDSMYLMLLPCMFFLFQSLFFWQGKNLNDLRNLSLIIYLIHPAVIVVVRGLAKAAGLQGLLVHNSLLHFLTVASGSLAAAIVLVMLLNARRAPNAADSGRRQKDRAWAEINLSNLQHNVQVLKEALPAGCEIMAVVKANAYGHGAAQISNCLNHIGIDTFAVATIDEGIHLRRQGIKGEILILGYTPAARISGLYRYRLSQTIADAEHARELNGFGKPIKVHVKVDTGMNRLGESYQHTSEIASIFDCNNLNVTGIFTHLCVSDKLEESDAAFTDQQIRCFYELLDELKARQINIPDIHIQSSYGILNYPRLQCEYARIGIALYGVLSTLDTNTKCSLALRPVLALKSKVALVRTIAPGESVGYGRSFITPKEMQIAVISIGYADGFPRSLSTKGHVLIRGCRAPIIGRICMDQLMADVTKIPDVQRGDVVTLIGKDGSEEITAEQVAAKEGTITNELLSRLNDSRLQRIFSNF